MAHDVRSTIGSMNWVGSELPSDAGVVRISPDCEEEILSLAAELERNPLTTEALTLEDFDLPHCRGLMRGVRSLVEDELGFAIIDRLPLHEIGRELAVKVYWLLASMLSRPVAQNWKGALIYGVADVTGKKPGGGIRPDVTNAEQNFHTDNSYNVMPPDHVCLLCLQTARSGGVSRIVSLETARERLERHRPDLLKRLCEPFLFDRQREHAPGDRKWIRNRIFSNDDGRLGARLSAYLVRQGYELAGEDIDPKGDAALCALAEIVDDESLYQEFWFEPGQIQILDNRRIAHKRTAFEDWPQPERRRHLVRLWLRERGRRFYHG